jgi:lipoprotein-anchoring transpeptidase ErfK/SrfK
MNRYKLIAMVITLGLSASTLAQADVHEEICNQIEGGCRPTESINSYSSELSNGSYANVGYAYKTHAYPFRSFGQKKLGPLPKQLTTSAGERMFVFAPRLRMWAAYDKSGNRVAFGRANGGSDFCQDLGHKCYTPIGTFRVQSKGSASCISKKFPLPRGGAPMPYCMHFGGGFAIHGSPGISYVNGSHGCIRVTTPAAAWLSHNFINHGTKVVVLSY